MTDQQAVNLSSVQGPIATTKATSKAAISETAPAVATDRLANTTLCLPLVHGSVAWYLGAGKNEFQTHQWSLYLRGPNNEDISNCIEKVVFQLHPSFAQPIRIFNDPPFEVTEKGWGEFEAQIKIHWRDTTEKTTMLSHGIKLYPPGAPANVTTGSASTTEPVVSEVYDEVVFTNPNRPFADALNALASLPTIKPQYSQHEQFLEFSDADDARVLLEAQKYVQEQLASVKQRMSHVDAEMKQVDASLIELDRSSRAAPASKKHRSS